MAKLSASFDVVRTLAQEFSDLRESTMYGSPAVKLGDRLVACIASHRSAEPGSLVLRTDFEQREALLAEDPDTFYITEHYLNHPVVLVRMTRVHRDLMRELLAAARTAVLAHTRRRVTGRENYSPKRPGRS